MEFGLIEVTKNTTHGSGGIGMSNHLYNPTFHTIMAERVLT